MTSSSRLKGARCLLQVTALAAALTLGACGGGSSGSPAPSSNLLRSQRYEQVPALTQLSEGRLLRYAMPAVRGGSTEANALLFVPRGPAPAGGWPLLVWAHGTTGVADACAPSRVYDRLWDRELVARSLQAGFAVLAPDYEGLDAPGTHPYLNPDSLARAVIEAVRAAHAVEGVRLAAGWAVAGHSEGGLAALATAERAAEILPSLPLKAAVALAPATDVAASWRELQQRIASLEASGDVEGAGATLFSLAYNLAMLSHGLQAQDPSLQPAQWLDPAFAPLAAQAEPDAGCEAFGSALEADLGRHLAAGSLPSAYRLLRSGAMESGPVATVLARQAAGQRKIAVPVLWLQGSEDGQTPVGAARATVRRLQAQGSPLHYAEVPGADHGSIVETRFDQALDFLRERLR